MDTWEFKVVGINIESTPPVSIEKDSQQFTEVSKEYLEREFSDYYNKKKSSNLALQCQMLINIYGKNGWEHYFQGQASNQVLFYFKKKHENIDNQVDSQSLLPEDEALLQSLDPLQKP